MQRVLSQVELHHVTHRSVHCIEIRRAVTEQQQTIGLTRATAVRREECGRSDRCSSNSSPSWGRRAVVRD